MDENNENNEFNEDNQDQGPSKRNIKRYIHKVTDKEGFYIILFVCICIVATTAVWVSRNNYNKLNTLENRENVDLVEDIDTDEDFSIIEETTSDNDDTTQYTENEQAQSVEENSQASTDQSNQASKEQKTNNKEEQMTKATEEQKTNELEEQETKAIETAATKEARTKILSSMVVPASGNILLDYAEDKLVYSKTLEQWTTHTGVDISAKEGSVVRAAMDGVVYQIKKDDALGIVITLDHGNDVMTKYGSLSTSDMVTIGQTIKKGDPISGVGKGTSYELVEGPHLHFEILVNGENVNPQSYLPKFD